MPLHKVKANAKPKSRPKVKAKAKGNSKPKYTRKKPHYVKKIKIRKARAKAKDPVHAKIVGNTEFIILRDHVIQRIRISDSQTIKQLAGTKTKAPQYIVFRAIEAVKLLFKGRAFVEIHDFVIHQSWHRDWVYAALITKPNTNHPIIVFANVNDGIMYLIRPFGKDPGQIGLDELERMLDSKFKDMINRAEYYALYLAFQESIRQRKRELIYNDRHSLLKCSNIQACLKKQRELTKKRAISSVERERELKKWNDYYEKKSIRFMEKYFKLLDDREYNEALMFLKGGNVHNSKYFGKQRLDTFYNNTKNIIGHLQIFIDLYQFVYKLTDRFQHS